MIAFDTNILVRIAANDNPAQVAIAHQLMHVHTVLIPRTVLLETEWVLRARYNRPRGVLAAFFTALLEAENVMVEGAEQVEEALEWYRLGADFADALHLAACGSALMHTFDRGFCKAAREAGITPEFRVLEVE